MASSWILFFIYLNHVYFTYIWYSTFTVHVPTLITIELLLIVKSKFTANVLHLNQCTYEQFQSWTVAHFQRSRGGCEWFDRHQERVGVVSVHFQLRVIALDIWRFPTHTNLQDWVWTNVGAVYRKNVFADIRWCGVIPYCVVGNSLLNFGQTFVIHPL